MPDINENVTMVGLAAVVATGSGADYINADALGALFFLEITLVAGTTPTLDIKLQAKDPTSGQYQDIPGAAFAQKTAAGRDMLAIYPSLIETANKKVSFRLPRVFRFYWTLGGTTPSFTFSIGASLLRGTPL